MTVYFEKEKHLDIFSARRSESGDIEVLSSNYDTAKSVYLIEYDLEWFVVIEKPTLGDDSPTICAFEPHRISNQLDAYKLNAIL